MVVWATRETWWVAKERADDGWLVWPGSAPAGAGYRAADSGKPVDRYRLPRLDYLWAANWPTWHRSGLSQAPSDADAE